MKAVILAGGLGTRLKPLTSILPKPLLPVGEKSIIEIMLTRLKSHGFDEAFILTNYKSHLFENYFKDGYFNEMKITLSKEVSPLGTAGPIKLISEKLTEPFLVINGDILTTLNFGTLRDLHNHHNADLTVATKLMQIPFHYGIIESNDNIFVHGVNEKPSLGAEINAGIYFMSPNTINDIPEGFYNMTDLIKKLLLNNKRVLKYKFDDYWLDIGQINNYRQAQKDIDKFDIINDDDST
ncbi:mannose-1-phosphate guanyltransferase [Candidatus Pacearchaeota archaeon CG10_big_fil_rev_8_21_14_0_10_32_14]|nr:MAG: mannose-1-phosphate guanyltransferase [Candidatus Pacearchaeota archaeon CG10_big_fil_rev_8_21_14_0_10_32_14]